MLFKVLVLTFGFFSVRSATVCNIANTSGIVDEDSVPLSSAGYTINTVLDPPPPIGPLPNSPYWNPVPRSIYRMTLSFVSALPIHRCDSWAANTVDHAPTGMKFYDANGTLLYATESTTTRMRNVSYSYPFANSPNISSVYIEMYKSTTWQARLYYLACYTCMIVAGQTDSVSPSYSFSPSLAMSVVQTPSWSSSPLFQVVPYPTTSVTPSVAVTTTPLFMVTAWPTVSPVNVSVPPSASSSSPTSSTGVILGAVAVGLVGLLIVGFAVNHFRKGGTVAGFMKEVESKKEDLKKVASMLPLSEEHKAKLDKALADPSSLLPVEAQKMLDSVKEVKDKVVSALPISEEQKAQLNTVIESLPQKLVEKVSSPKVEPEPKPQPESVPEVEKEIPQREVSIVIDSAHIEAVKQFLASKNAEVKTD